MKEPLLETQAPAPCRSALAPLSLWVLRVQLPVHLPRPRAPLPVPCTPASTPSAAQGARVLPRFLPSSRQIMASCRCLNLWFRFCINLDISVVLGHVLSCSRERSAPAPLLSVFLVPDVSQPALTPLGAAEGELGWPRVCGPCSSLSRKTVPFLIFCF